MRITALPAAFLACLISTQCHAIPIDCAKIKSYVDQLGFDFVEQQAELRGFSKEKIAAVMKACSIKQK